MSLAIGSSDVFITIEPVTRKFYGLGEKGVKAQYSQIADVDSSDEPIREFAEFGGPGRLDLKYENAPMQGKSIKAGPVKRVDTATYAGGITISREAVDDTKYRQIKTAASSLGRATAMTPEYLFAQFLDRSHDSTYVITADGKELCSTSHLTPYGVAFANTLATPAALSEESMEDIKTALRTTIGPDGMLKPVMLKQWIVPSALGHLIKKITSTPRTLGSNNNDVNVNDGDKYMIFDFLTNTTRFYAQTDAENGFYWDWRQKPTFERDNQPNNLQALFFAWCRMRWGAEDPRCVYASNAS